MKIETNDWLSVAEAVKQSGIPQKTFYTIANRLGVVVEFFGTKCLRKKDVAKVVAARGRPGNPDWIGSYDKARKSALRAVESRMRRIEEVGMTEAELARSRRLPSVTTPAE